jgi:hypothetical protein
MQSPAQAEITSLLEVKEETAQTNSICIEKY